MQNNLNRIFPFAALVGQKDLKLALSLAAINPALGGVLIRGEKGTAKSSAVRGLSELMPWQDETEGCPYNCHPEAPCSRCDRLPGTELKSHQVQARVVELPVGATEDRLLGSLDVESALASGETRFQPGILARANRQVLYVDEVNLLDDHLVDALLDAAAMGVNTVEREGLSISHPARFSLVGTMNPEEGELRPQLTDRFGLCVEVKGVQDIASRREIITRRLAFEKDPAEFREQYKARGKGLSAKLEAARDLLPHVQAGQKVMDRVIALVMGLKVDGHRGDITLYKTSLAIAALEGRANAKVDDVDRAALLALPHRLRKRPLAGMNFDIAEKIKQID